ncbi:unnamed protein product [Allacma fusca]|uniref:Uncharacterized protein n=1 Tax=Allacma fusca TaxID=39272 RepID=A0A8J2LT93_9HEXA|nr:unnamed protein product [Allacma fusca]
MQSKIPKSFHPLQWVIYYHYKKSVNYFQLYHQIVLSLEKPLLNSRIVTGIQWRHLSSLDIVFSLIPTTNSPGEHLSQIPQSPQLVILGESRTTLELLRPKDRARSTATVFIVVPISTNSSHDRFNTVTSCCSRLWQLY